MPFQKINKTEDCFKCPSNGVPSLKMEAQLYCNYTMMANKLLKVNMFLLGTARAKKQFDLIIYVFTMS